MAAPKAFIDTSVLIAAILSPTGGSFYLLTQLQNKFDFQINEYVLEETRRVLNQKFSGRKDLFEKLFLIIGLAGIFVLPNPAPVSINRVAKFINREDAPILLSAVESCQYLVTLDDDFFAPHIVEFAAERQIEIVKPGDLVVLFRQS